MTRIPDGASAPMIGSIAMVVHMPPGSSSTVCSASTGPDSRTSQSSIQASMLSSRQRCVRNSPHLDHVVAQIDDAAGLRHQRAVQLDPWCAIVPEPNAATDQDRDEVDDDL